MAKTGFIVASYRSSIGASETLVSPELQAALGDENAQESDADITRTL
jgi:hypothetical protein